MVCTPIYTEYLLSYLEGHETMSAQLFQKSRSYLKTLCSRGVTQCKFHIRDIQIFVTTTHGSRVLCTPA